MMPCLWQKVKKIQEPLNETKKSENVGLKLNMQKTKIMASGPISSWQIYGEPWKQWLTLFLGGSKITTDGNCRHEIQFRAVQSLSPI